MVALLKDIYQAVHHKDRPQEEGRCGRSRQSAGQGKAENGHTPMLSDIALLTPLFFRVHTGEEDNYTQLETPVVVAEAASVSQNLMQQ